MSSRLRKRTTIVAMPLLAAAILALAACGGGDDPGSGESESAASGTTGADAVAPETNETVSSDGEREAGRPLLVIMDASGSMKKPLEGGDRRIDAAKQALSDLVASLPEGQQVGLRIFGGSKQAGCSDTELVAPVAPLDPDALDSAIAGLEPAGKTPIGSSLHAAGSDLPDEGDRTIILVSDGKATCAPPDPCDVARDLKAQGIDVRIETVGFALGADDAARRQLTCIAEATGGSFHDVSDAGELSETLGVLSFNPEPQAVECPKRFKHAPTLEAGVYTYTLKYTASAYAHCAIELGGARKVEIQMTTSPGPDGRACAGPQLSLFGDTEDNLLKVPDWVDGDCKGSDPLTLEGTWRTPRTDRLILAMTLRCSELRCFDTEYPVEFKVRPLR